MNRQVLAMYGTVYCDYTEKGCLKKIAMRYYGQRIRIHIRIRRQRQDNVPRLRIHVMGNVESGSVDSGNLFKMPPDGKQLSYNLAWLSVFILQRLVWGFRGRTLKKFLKS